ncbi:MAG TPA: hypothetical protein VJ576_21340 [Rhodocyclaceae bacterium]|nr:hypothetical protein [Rhodocyclaceae bacterium]
MHKWIAYAFAALLAGSAAAQTPSAAPADPVTGAGASDCAARAVGKNGKPLAGAARKSFMEKCERDNPGGADAACEAKAVGKNGKPLAGAAKSSFMKKCKQLAH